MDHDTPAIALGIAAVGIALLLAVAGTAVGDAGSEPTAEIEYDPTSPTVDEAVTFVANASDPDGTIVAYEWTVDGVTVARSRTFQYAFETVGDHLVSVVVTDEDGATTTANTTVSVAEGTGPNFSVAAARTSSPVVEGDRMAVTATIENVGDRAGTQTVTLSVGDAVRDSREVTLGGGENRTITLAWATGEGDGGTYTASVTTDNGSAVRDVQVLEPATFTVSVDSTNSPVMIGDRDAHNLEINVTVRNVGDQPGNRTVTLAVGNVERDATDLALDAGESRQVTLRWTVKEGDAGTYTARVATANDSVRTDVRVNAPSSADLSVVETNAPVEAGSVLTLAVRVDAPGSGTSSETVSLSVGGELRDSREMTLGGGENRTITLAWETSPGDAGEYTANVSGEQVTIQQPVTVVEANSPPTVDAVGYVQCDPDCDGEPTFVERSNAEWDDLTMVRGAKNGSQFVANTSDDGEIAGYEWAIDGEVVSDSRTLVYTFAEAGEHEVTLTVTDDDGASTTTSVTVDVNAPPTVDAIGFVQCDPECDGDPVFASSNDSALGQEELTIAYDRYKRTKLVAPDASDPDGTVGSYEWTVDGDPAGSGPELTYTFEDPGEHEMTLTVTDDDGTSTTVSSTVVVNAPPDPAFDVSGDDPMTGETVTIEAAATDPDGTVESYEWRVDGEVVSRSEALEHTFESGGEHRVALAVTDDDGTERTVTQTISVAAAPAGGGNGGPNFLLLLMGLVAVGAIGTAGYYYVRFRQVTGGTGDSDAAEASGPDGGDDYNETETIIDPEPSGASASGDGDGGQTQHDEFDSEDKMTEDSGDGDGDNMDPSDSAFPPFTDTDGATDSGGDGDDDDYNETETIIDPEPGGASDSGGDGGGSPAGESSEDVTGTTGDDGATDEHTGRVDWGDANELESTGDGGESGSDSEASAERSDSRGDGPSGTDSGPGGEAMSDDGDDQGE